MPYLTKYHIKEQEARALLGPIVASLRELEERAHHFTQRLVMEPSELQTVAEAHKALEEARSRVEQLWLASRSK